MSDAPDELQEVLFNNLHYTTKGLGLAFRRKRSRVEPGMVYYISFAGSNTACESLRASLHKRGARLPACRWSNHQEPVAPGMTTAKRKLPNSAELHYILWRHTPELIIIRDDRMLLARQTPSPERQQAIDALKQAYQPQLELLFTQAINAIAKAPMLPEWAATVLRVTSQEGWERLEARGDVVHALLLNPQYDWSRKLRHLLTDGAIAIPPLAPDLQELLAASQARQAADAATDAATGADTDMVTDAADDADAASRSDLAALDVEMYLAPAPRLHAPPAHALTTPAHLPFLFEPGQIVATTHFTQTVGATFDAMHYLYRHLTGDWRETEMPLEDIRANQRAARATGDHQTRVFSAFHAPDDHGPQEPYLEFWVITEADRSATTFLLPADY